MSWEYLALGAYSTSDDNSENVSGPHAVLVVDGPDHRPETGRTQFAALPLNFTAIRQAESLGSTPREACIAQLARNKKKKSSPHPEYARHADASCEIC